MLSQLEHVLVKNHEELNVKMSEMECSVLPKTH